MTQILIHTLTSAFECPDQHSRKRLARPRGMYGHIYGHMRMTTVQEDQRSSALLVHILA